MKKVYKSSEETGAPISGAWEANGLVFVSGQIHADKEWNIIDGTVAERFEITIKNVEDILAEAGLTKEDIVQLRIYLTDISELKDLNEAYKAYFKHPLPARAAVGVSALPLGATLEIEVIAVRS